MGTIKYLLFISIIFVVGCQSSETESSKTPETHNGASADTVSMTLDRGYQNAYRYVRGHGEDFLCYAELTSIQTQSINVHKGWSIGSEASLICRDSDRLLFEYHPNEREHIVDVLVLTNGNILVALAQLNRHDDINFHELKLQLFDQFGNQLISSVLEDPLSGNEGLFYQIEDGLNKAEDYSALLVQNGKPQLFPNAPVQLYEHDQKVYLLAMTYGLKLYQLDDSLNRLWGTQLFPLNESMVSSVFVSGSNNFADFAISNSGNVAVSYRLNADYIPIFEQHFSQNLTRISNGIDILLQQISNDGVRKTSVVTGDQSVHDFPVEIFWKGDKVQIIGNGLYEKDSASGGTKEWDMYAMTVLPTTGEVVSYKTFDIDKEDQAYAAVTVGENLFIAGHSGYVQVDTNSVVENGYGLLSKVDSSGNLIELVHLDVSRDSIVTGMTKLDDTLVYSYVYDSPITHTCDSGQPLCYNRAGIGEIALE